MAGEESWTHFSVEYRHHLGPHMDDIVDKTRRICSYLLPCQEIDMTCHKLSPNGHFMSKFPSSTAAILPAGFSGPATKNSEPAEIPEATSKSRWASTC